VLRQPVDELVEALALHEAVDVTDGHAYPMVRDPPLRPAPPPNVSCVARMRPRPQGGLLAGGGAPPLSPAESCTFEFVPIDPPSQSATRSHRAHLRPRYTTALTAFGVEAHGLGGQPSAGAPGSCAWLLWRPRGAVSPRRRCELATPSAPWPCSSISRAEAGVSSSETHQKGVALGTLVGCS
jgi:hypothetical protein